MDKKFLYLIILIIAAGIAVFLVSRPVTVDQTSPVTIFGIWQSVDDAMFVRQFANDYTFSDVYNDQLVDQGVWGAFTKNNPVSTDYPLEADTLYLELTSQATKQQFKVASVGTSSLELMLLGGGGSLKFIRQ